MKNNITPVQELIKIAGQRGATKEELDTLLEARRVEKKYIVSPTVGQVLDKSDQMDDFIAHMRVIEPFYPSEIGALLDLDKVLSFMDEYAFITITEFYKKVGLENELNTTNNIALEVYNTHGWTSSDICEPRICPCFISYTGTRGFVISMPKPHLLFADKHAMKGEKK